MKDPRSAAITRAALPEILFVPDVAIALGVMDSAARKTIVRGEIGPYFRIGRRLAVRRESFLAALAEREVIPERPPAPPRPPKPSTRMVQLLQKRNRRQS